MSYQDVLSRATPRAPSRLERMSPILQKIRDRLNAVITIGALLIEAAPIRRIPFESQSIGKYELMSELFQLAQLPTDLDRTIDRQDFINPKFFDLFAAGFSTILPKVRGLGPVSKKKVFLKSNSFLNYFYLIRHYANRPEYKDHPKSLLAAIHGLPDTCFKGTITASIQKYCINFYIENDDDYALVHGGDPELAIRSGGFFGGKSQIQDLQGCITYERGAYKEEDRSTLAHEERHAKNKVLQQPFVRNYHKNEERQNIEQMLEYAKDEIIAYMTDSSRSPTDIFLTLWLNTDNVFYDYRKHLPHGSIKDPDTLQKVYNDELWDLISIAEELAAEKIPNLLNLLAITPAKNWRLLKAYFLNPKWHIKYAENRTDPYCFDHLFTSMTDENTVLAKMHELSPEHTVRPIYQDPSGGFSITERYGTNDTSKVRIIPQSIADEIQSFVEHLHAHGLAHGDLPGNILFEIDSSGTAIGFKVIDPVGISAKINSKFFDQAKKRDLESLNFIMKSVEHRTLN